MLLDRALSQHELLGDPAIRAPLRHERGPAERAYGLAEPPGAPELEQIAEPWRPQRTLACLYLWRSLDAEP